MRTEELIKELESNSRGLAWTEEGEIGRIKLVEGKVYKVKGNKIYSLPSVDSKGRELKLYYRTPKPETE
jgi:hypothetical protein